MTESTHTEEQSTKKGKKKKKEQKEEMSFLDHLEELRWHIIRAFLAIIIFAIAAFLSKDFIFDSVIFLPKSPDFWTNVMFAKLAEFTGIESLRINSVNLELISLKMADNFMTHIMVSIIAGLVLSSPYVFFEIWRFIQPALYEKERKHSSGAVVYMSMLFILGVLFGYYLIVPLSIHFLGSYSISTEITNQINMRSFISTVTSISLAGGIIFELPIFVYFLSKVGILTPDVMKRYRKHSFVGLLLLSAIITPPDVFSQIMVCFPLVLLYEIGIVISKKVLKNKQDEFDAI